MRTAPTRRVQSWLTHELASRLVREAVAALGPSVSVMPLKGALVARTLYSDPAERPMTDCDVLAIGVPFRDALVRLYAAGFEARQWSNQRDVVVLGSATVPGLQLDLHTRPLPRGFGRVTAAWLAEGAREDLHRFGARVVLPEDTRLLVHLLGNIAKDHVYRSAPHHARDVALLLAQTRRPLSAFAEAARDARLRGACWMALDWIAEVEPSSPARQLQRAIEPGRARGAAWRARLAYLRRAARAVEPPLPARVLVRASGDRAADVAIAIAESAIALPAAWLRAQRASRPR